MNRLEQLIAREITDLMALRALIKDGMAVPGDGLQIDASTRHQAYELAKVEAQLAELGVNVDELEHECLSPQRDDLQADHPPNSG